jgi:Flp pilus assembly protein protease CpaA
MLVVGFMLFAVHAFGAGDAKLLAAVALWAGPEYVLDLVLVTAVVGGVFSLVIIFARRLSDRFLIEYRIHALTALLFGSRQPSPADPDADTPQPAARAVSFARPIPYGVAIGAGAALVAYGLLTTSVAA